MTITYREKEVIDKMIEAPYYFYLDGDIDSTSPQVLKRYLDKVRPARVEIYINSNGGNLFAGMELGRVIREYGSNTTIGRIHKADKYGAHAGGCYSACALAFLGGKYRYAKDGSKYGVHRFSSTAQPASGDMDTAQIVSAAVNAYIRDMGALPALFDLMVSAGSREMYVLTAPETKKLQVINDGRLPPVWVIDATEKGMLIKGSQETWVGEGYFSLICENKRLVFFDAYTAGDKNQMIAKGGWVHSLFIDDATLPLPSPKQLFVQGDFIFTMVPVPMEYYAKIRMVKKQVGHAMQMSRDAPTFVGYHVDVNSDKGDSARIRGFIDNCVKT